MPNICTAWPLWQCYMSTSHPRRQTDVDSNYSTPHDALHACWGTVTHMSDNCGSMQHLANACAELNPRYTPVPPKHPNLNLAENAMVHGKVPTQFCPCVLQHTMNSWFGLPNTPSWGCQSSHEMLLFHKKADVRKLVAAVHKSIKHAVDPNCSDKSLKAEGCIVLCNVGVLNVLDSAHVVAVHRETRMYTIVSRHACVTVAEMLRGPRRPIDARTPWQLDSGIAFPHDPSRLTVRADLCAGVTWAGVPTWDTCAASPDTPCLRRRHQRATAHRFRP